MTTESGPSRRPWADDCLGGRRAHSGPTRCAAVSRLSAHGPIPGMSVPEPIARARFGVRPLDRSALCAGHPQAARWCGSRDTRGVRSDHSPQRPNPPDPQPPSDDVARPPPSELALAVAAAIKAARIGAGHTQAYVAEQAGPPLWLLRDAERGRRALKLVEAAAIAEALDLSRRAGERVGRSDLRGTDDGKDPGTPRS